MDIDPGNYVMLGVSDSGYGIAEETLKHVFEPFFTTKEVGKGTGMGLSMVHGFAKQSGGSVTIKSELGVGTNIKLYLPRAAEQGDETHPGAAPVNDAGTMNCRGLTAEVRRRDPAMAGKRSTPE